MRVIGDQHRIDGCGDGNPHVTHCLTLAELQVQFSHQFINRFAKYRIDQLLLEQPGLIQRLGHRHQDLDLIRDEQVVGPQGGGCLQGNLQLFERHRDGPDTIMAEKKAGGEGLQIDDRLGQKPRRRQVAKIPDNVIDGMALIFQILYMSRERLNSCLPEKRCVRAGNHRTKGARRAGLTHHGIAVDHGDCTIPVDINHRQGNAGRFPGQRSASQLLFAFINCVSQLIAKAITRRRQRNTIDRPAVPCQAAAVHQLPILKGIIGWIDFAGVFIVGGTGAVRHNRLQYHNPQAARCFGRACTRRPLGRDTVDGHF